MRKNAYIMLGGALGAILRFEISNFKLPDSNMIFPINTFFINITGCFILALFLSIVLEVTEFEPDLRLGVSIGFIGAYTTFSTLCKESVNLIMGGDYIVAFSYILLSAVFGLIAIYLGNLLAKVIIARFIIKDNDSMGLKFFDDEEAE